MSLLRSIAVVILGYIVFAVSAAMFFQGLGVNPHAPQSAAFVAGTAAFGMAFAFLGGLIAARLAPGRRPLHAGLVAVLIAAGAVGSLLASPPTDGTWSQWMAVLLMAPSAALAGLVGRRQASPVSTRVDV
ncbi:MAG: hypothetical protein ABIX28_12555 [Vicinamibacterales bacterium]